MYDDHYGFTGRPFQLTPDPRFWFDTATHRKAMAYLGYGLSQGEGFIVITGDVGAGKTTLVGHLMATVDRDRLQAIRIVSPQIGAGDHALLQIFLLGQPEFRERLHGSDRLEQLRQRVIATHHLEPMEREEVA